MEEHVPSPSPALLRRSPFDVRDWRYAERCGRLLAATPPRELDYRSEMREARNQGARGTCASFAAAAMKEWQELRDVGFKSYMSPEFVYDNRENEAAAGMYPRDVMRILQTLGACPEGVCPYSDVDRRRADVPQLAYEIATKFTIASYAQVTSVDELKLALANSGPCLMAFPCFNGTTSFWKPRSAAEAQGGHAVLCVGYTADAFVLRNSWGAAWGDKGHAYYPFAEWGAHWEAWSAVDAKTDPGALPPAPAPAPPGRARCCGCI